MFRRRHRKEDYESVLFPKDEEKVSDDSSVEDTGKKEMYPKTSFVVQSTTIQPITTAVQRDSYRNEMN